MPPKILGISAFYHDSAAALVEGPFIIAAAQEERFSRLKHDAAFPKQAIRACLKLARCSIDDVESVVYYESPRIKLDRQIRSYLDAAPMGLGSFLRFGKRRLFERTDPLAEIAKGLGEFSSTGVWKGQVETCLHHSSHAAGAFYPSSFDEAIIITVDGVGEWDTTTISIGRGSKIERLESIAFPHSLGLLYSAFTAYCGFRVNDGEYKLMGLAPYGRPRFADAISRSLLSVKADGSFRLNLAYFDFISGARMFSEKFETLFDGPARRRDEPITQRHMDVAASIQVVLEDTLLKLVRHAVDVTGIRRVCLSGGVALNCVANGKILRSGLVDDVWVQPAAGDAGGALGCALHHYYATATNPQRVADPGDSMRGSRLGPAYAPERIQAELDALGAKYVIASEEETIEWTADALASGDVVGWVDGPMEFGPRALGGRSILADPRRPDMQRTLNMKVKLRESFRPFAPIVLAEEASEWFDLEGESPYMLIVTGVKEKYRLRLTPAEEALVGFESLNCARSAIPAVTHVDYSARIQTVDQRRNAKLHQLLRAFQQRTGVPILVNTSFNLNEEPIVCTPGDAYRCFVKTQIDRLVIGNFLMIRADQPAAAAEKSAMDAGSPPPSGQAPDDFLYTLH